MVGVLARQRLLQEHVIQPFDYAALKLSFREVEVRWNGRFTLRSQWVDATPVRNRAIRVSVQRVLQGCPQCWSTN